MEQNTLLAKIKAVASRRQYLLGLLERPNLGTLSLDVNQALEELDELLEEAEQRFPQEKFS